MANIFGFFGSILGYVLWAAFCNFLADAERLQLYKILSAELKFFS